MKKLENGSFEIDLNFNLSDLDGKEIQGSNVGKLVASFLAKQTKGDYVKFMCWALDLNQGKKITLDRSDKDTLKDLITKSEEFTAILKSPFESAFTE